MACTAQHYAAPLLVAEIAPPPPPVPPPADCGLSSLFSSLSGKGVDVQREDEPCREEGGAVVACAGDDAKPAAADGDSGGEAGGNEEDARLGEPCREEGGAAAACERDDAKPAAADGDSGGGAGGNEEDARLGEPCREEGEAVAACTGDDAKPAGTCGDSGGGAGGNEEDARLVEPCREEGGAAAACAGGAENPGAENGCAERSDLDVPPQDAHPEECKVEAARANATDNANTDAQMNGARERNEDEPGRGDEGPPVAATVQVAHGDAMAVDTRSESHAQGRDAAPETAHGEKDTAGPQLLAGAGAAAAADHQTLMQAMQAISNAMPHLQFLASKLPAAINLEPAGLRPAADAAPTGHTAWGGAGVSDRVPDLAAKHSAFAAEDARTTSDAHAGGADGAHRVARGGEAAGSWGQGAVKQGPADGPRACAGGVDASAECERVRQALARAVEREEAAVRERDEAQKLLHEHLERQRQAEARMKSRLAGIDARELARAL